MPIKVFSATYLLLDKDLNEIIALCLLSMDDAAT